jgi:hypothetical protein
MKEHLTRAIYFDAVHSKQASHNDKVCSKDLACAGTCCLYEGHVGKCLCIGDKKDTPGTCSG